MPGQGDDVFDDFVDDSFEELFDDSHLMDAQDVSLEPSGTQATTGAAPPSHVAPPTTPEPSTPSPILADPPVATNHTEELKPSKLAIQAKNLITLRRETLNQIEANTKIRTPNLSVWLRGKTEQVLSFLRIARLLSYLGVDNKRLRNDMLHLWYDEGDLLNTEYAFQNWLSTSSERVLVEDDISSFPQVRFLFADEVLIRLEITAGLKEARSLADVFKPTKTVHVSSPLSEVPVKSIDEARIRLDELMGMVDTSLPAPAAGAVAMNDLALSEKDAELLHAALRRAFQAGATVEQIANLLDGHWGQTIAS